MNSYGSTGSKRSVSSGVDETGKLGYISLPFYTFRSSLPL